MTGLEEAGGPRSCLFLKGPIQNRWRVVHLLNKGFKPPTLCLLLWTEAGKNLTWHSTAGEKTSDWRDSELFNQ